MTTLDSVETIITRSSPSSTRHPVDLRCVICNAAFDFAAGEFAVILRHVAYGYDLAHSGDCLDSAHKWIFAEPGYDCAAFGPDVERQGIIAASDSQGWAVVFPSIPEGVVPGRAVRSEMLWCWALVEHRDGSRRWEGLVRDPEWITEPGALEFPEARIGSRASLGYASPAQLADPEHVAAWESTLVERLGIGLPTRRMSAPRRRSASSAASHSVRRLWALFGTHR